ncbi:unnamed protein product [Eruca vesicaria subsp. sativa]|uniref:Uncharacterized protein n=1 Tax=Eruca vesicaria subsp. sativa TaxID=29727 RepID=A0ABC8KQ70_ERUVS|nr:unnamed protein product [Eruca vesicaria subsp. sativa]
MGSPTKGVQNLTSDGMELEGVVFNERGGEKEIESEEEFENLTDEEEENKDVVGAKETEEDNLGTDTAEELEVMVADAAKKGGVRKPIVSTTVGGPMTKKFAQVLLSPRKRQQLKPIGSRKGGGSKPGEMRNGVITKPNLK